MQLRPGQTLHSTTDTTTVVIVRAPEDDVTITCGGHPMSTDPAEGSPSDEVDAGTGFRDQGAGALLGKRYVVEEFGLELLCTRAGTWALEANGAPCQQKAATPLPASD